MNIPKKLYYNLKVFRDMGLIVNSIFVGYIMFVARQDYKTLIYLDLLFEGRLEYIIFVIWCWVTFIVFLIDKYEVKK